MRALVIGHGCMGRHHARVLRDLGLDVVTIDPAAEADRPVLSRTPRAEVAVIATPAPQLAAAAAQALHAGLHVLVEKPMATTLADARALAALAQETGRTLAVGFTERHNPAVRRLRELLAPLRRTVIHVELVRHGPPPDRPAPRPHLDLMVHDLDLLRFLGFAPRVLSGRRGPGFASAHLDLGNGASASLTASHVAPAKTRRLVVHAESATLTLDLAARTLRVEDRWCSWPSSLPPGEPLMHEWRDFLAAVRTGRPPLAGAADGIAALELALALGTPEPAASRGSRRRRRELAAA